MTTNIETYNFAYNAEYNVNESTEATTLSAKLWSKTHNLVYAIGYFTALAALLLCAFWYFSSDGSHVVSGAMIVAPIVLGYRGLRCLYHFMLDLFR